MDYFALERKISKLGFNHSGVVSLRDTSFSNPTKVYIENEVPWALSAMVLGTGGARFWKQLSEMEKSKKNPIDFATIHRVRGILEELRSNRTKYKVLFPFRSSGRKVNFMEMGAKAGLGASETRLGILIHPVFGPWVSLRALIFCSEGASSTGPIENFQPCVDCDEPCVQACPVGAFSKAGFNAKECGKHVLSDASCNEYCLSRKACVYGQEHAYEGEEGMHRQFHARKIFQRYFKDFPSKDQKI